MSKLQQVIEIISEIMEVDSTDITLATELDETVWDSLAVVTFISEVDSKFDQILSPSDVGAVKKVSDLVNLVK